MSDKSAKLKQGQIDILELLYKYRFTSRELLLESLGEGSGTSVNLYQKLEVLIKRDLVLKRFEPKQKLLGLPYAYCLTPKGVKTLRELPAHDNITDTVIKGWYRNKTIDLSFVFQTMAIHTYTNRLSSFYPALRVFTKRDLTSFDYFPDQLPDAVLSLARKDNTPLRYFLDIIPAGTPRRAIDGKLKNYCEYFESGGWDVMESNFPAILLVASNRRAERQLQYIARSRLLLHDEDLNLRIYTTTKQAITKMNQEGLIWTQVTEPNTLRALTELGNSSAATAGAMQVSAN